MGWRHIVISKPGKLSLKLDNLIVQQDELHSVPIEDIATLIIESGQVSLSSSLAAKLGKNNIAVFFCDRRHLPVGFMSGFNLHSRQNRMINRQISLSKPFKKRVWQKIIKMKIQSQASALEYCTEKKNLHLLRLAEKVDSGDTKNMEAQAARFYFIQMFGPNFSREKEGLVNACLDYGYAIVRGIIARSLVGYGFFPAIGIHHRSELNNFNLADDFLEPYRPLIDAFVKRNFSDNEKFCTKHRKKLYSFLNCLVKMSGKRYSLNRSIEKMVQSFSSAAENENHQLLCLPEFTPLAQTVYE